MSKVPYREDYDDTTAWARDFENYVTQARSESLVRILRERLLAVLVCAPVEMGRDAVGAEVTRIHPTGLDHGWVVKNRPDNPAVCAKNADRRHWVLTC